MKTNLVRHKKGCTKSVEPNENLCNLCHKTFSTKKILHKHSKVHNKENTFAPTSADSCVVCEKTFAKKSNMERHKIKEHGLTEKGNVVANSAGIAIFTTEALVKETVIGRTTTPTLSHQCDQCEFNSQKSGNLKRHVQIKHDGTSQQLSFEVNKCRDFSFYVFSFNASTLYSMDDVFLSLCPPKKTMDECACLGTRNCQDPFVGSL